MAKPPLCKNQHPDGRVCDLYLDHYGDHKEKHLRSSWNANDIYISTIVKTLVEMLITELTENWKNSHVRYSIVDLPVKDLKIEEVEHFVKSYPDAERYRVLLGTYWITIVDQKREKEQREAYLLRPPVS